MRWIGIDEAGYGPNLGPMVMTAVVAEGPGDARPDPWTDLPRTICRASGPAGLLWIDDSKRLYRRGLGLDRLEAATLAAIDAAGRVAPTTLAALLDALGVPDAPTAELLPWLPNAAESPFPRSRSPLLVPAAFRSAPWRIVAIRSVVVGPSRFNRDLIATGSKALVHFAAFAELLDFAWSLAADGTPTLIRADKHGGRHFYADLLRSCLPPCSIIAGPEGPDLSRYRIRSDSDSHSLTIDLLPRADADDGLVSLASIVCKLVREYWMHAFNAYWARLVPGLLPTAGYPLDASRFRRDLLARLPDPDPPVESWWRLK